MKKIILLFVLNFGNVFGQLVVKEAKRLASAAIHISAVHFQSFCFMLRQTQHDKTKRIFTSVRAKEQSIT